MKIFLFIFFYFFWNAIKIAGSAQKKKKKKKKKNWVGRVSENTGIFLGLTELEHAWNRLRWIRTF